MTTGSGPALEAPAIHVTGLTKRYGSTEALAGLSLTVPRGEVFGFLGPNGAGKTTAVKLLLGLAAPTGGEAWLLGAPAGDAGTRARVGYLPELFRYQGWLTAREALLYCELARLPRPSWTDAIAGALHTAGLEGRGDDRVAGYSKGMQQRLGLGVALLGRPELANPDEPTVSALDPVGRNDVRTIIRGLRERGVAVFLNSHLLTEVERVCDRVAIVDRGRVVASGKLEELLGGTGVRVRQAGLDAAGIAGLARFGSVRTEDGWLTIDGLDGEGVPALVTEIVSRGGRVYAVEPRQTTLEDRFLQLVDHSEDPT